MAEVHMMPRHGQPPRSAGQTPRPPLTLAEEHVLPLWQVTASAEKLLTTAERLPPSATGQRNSAALAMVPP